MINFDSLDQSADNIAAAVPVELLDSRSIRLPPALAATLSSTHALPLEGLALLFGVDRIVNIGHAMTNLIGNALATVVVAKLDGDFDRSKALQAYRDYSRGSELTRV
jgi:hypothetical protein